MIDFSIKLRPFGKTYWIISPEDYRIRQCFTSLNSELAFRLSSIKNGESLIEAALEAGWVIVGLKLEAPLLNKVSGNFHAVVQVGSKAFINNSIFLNKLVGLLKILENNVQYNHKLPIYLKIYRFTRKLNVKEKRIIEDDFVSSSAFLHLATNKLLNSIR